MGRQMISIGYKIVKKYFVFNVDLMGIIKILRFLASPPLNINIYICHSEARNLLICIHYLIL
jgi:hypothetical protein